jgi:segregation and condensation protein B
MIDRPEAEVNVVAAVHALLLASPVPLSLQRLTTLTGAKREEVSAAIADLRSYYAAGPGGVGLQEIAAGWQLSTDPAYADVLAALDRSRPQPLSPAALETLAIIAYRQPVTRADIEAIRGVGADGVVGTLMERGLIREAGRRQAPGRPMLYGTTDEFLRYVGLRSLADLPEPDTDDDADTGPLPMMPAPNR